MNEPLSVSLAPSGAITLHLPRHQVELPMDDRGLDILRYVLQERAQGHTKIGEDGNPTQHIIRAWLRGESRGEKQLAGDAKRWKEIEGATEVRIRKLDAKGNDILTLENLDL